MTMSYLYQQNQWLDICGNLDGLEGEARDIALILGACYLRTGGEVEFFKSDKDGKCCFEIRPSNVRDLIIMTFDDGALVNVEVVEEIDHNIELGHDFKEDREKRWEKKEIE